jgi:hypothetical protein
MIGFPLTSVVEIEFRKKWLDGLKKTPVELTVVGRQMKCRKLQHPGESVNTLAIANIHPKN